jgi:hypothetical protein
MAAAESLQYFNRRSTSSGSHDHDRRRPNLPVLEATGYCYAYASGFSMLSSPARARTKFAAQID